MSAHHEAAVTVWAASERVVEVWRQDCCRPNCYDPNTERGCPLPVMRIAASRAQRTYAIPWEVADFLMDPCTAILHDSTVGWVNSDDPHRRKQIRALREQRAAQREVEGVRI